MKNDNRFILIPFLALGLTISCSTNTVGQSFRYQYKISVYDSSTNLQIHKYNQPCPDSKIILKVFDKNQMPLKGINIEIRSLSGIIAEVLTDHTGIVEKKIIPGDYQLEVTSPLYEHSLISITTTKDSCTAIIIYASIKQNRFLYTVSSDNKLKKKEINKIKTCLRLKTQPNLCSIIGRYIIEVEF
jgi:hypothetical protein